MSAEDETFHTAYAACAEENEDGDESSCPSPRKRIAPALALALTFIAFLLFTMLATGPPVPPHTDTQTMMLLNGGERDEQVSMAREGSSWTERRKSSRRLMSGLGSHPPSCKSKCGRCVPCKPVRVPIHPGKNRPLEYYPEAWRCKCGNKLYMP